MTQWEDVIKQSETFKHSSNAWGQISDHLELYPKVILSHRGTLISYRRGQDNMYQEMRGSAECALVRMVLLISGVNPN